VKACERGARRRTNDVQCKKTIYAACASASAQADPNTDPDGARAASLRRAVRAQHGLACGIEVLGSQRERRAAFVIFQRKDGSGAR
jgi:hypothetical protein